MSPGNETKAAWKQRARRELFEYWITALYLGLYLGAFMGYRRLLMAEYHIHYAHYGFAVIQALVLAKVILIGDAVGVGRRLREDRPLIYITLFRAVRFTLWVAFFTVLEHMLEGLVRGEGWMGGLNELLRLGKYELLASSLVIFFTFIPFFAFRELNRALGQHTIWNLFFRNYGARNASTGPGPTSGAAPGTTEYEL
jgi:hypothetical protein